MDNFLTLEQGIAKFKELTEQYGTKLITYSWDAGHAYSMLDSGDNEGGTKMSMLSTEMSILLDAEQDQFFDHINEWLSNNDECPPCVPGGECGCSDINDIDTVRDYKQAHDKVYGKDKFVLWHPDLIPILLKAELDETVDVELGA